MIDSTPLKYNFSKKSKLVDLIQASMIIMGILLLGYWRIFWRHNFFIGEDPLLSFSWHANNFQSEGWRPDIGFGLNFFYADPGASHVWALLRWWHHLFSDPIVAYNTSIILLLWIACIAQYLFLKKVAPELNRTVAILLSTLIAFGSLQHELFFSRLWIFLTIGTSLISIIIYNFIYSPSVRHYFLYSLTLFFCVNLASTAALIQLIMFSIPFYFVLAVNLKLYKNTREFWRGVGRFFLLNLASGITLILLSAWTLYSIFLEQQLTGYVRDPERTFGAVLSPSLGGIISQVLGYLHAGIFSPAVSILGIAQKVNLGNSWNNVAPFFPIAFLLILFYKSKNPWESSIKIVVIAITVYHESIVWFPVILSTFQSILDFYPITKFQPVLQVFQIAVIAILLQRLQSNENIHHLAWPFTRILASLLVLIYACLFLLSITAVTIPNTLVSLGQLILDTNSSRINSQWLQQLGPKLIVENVRLFHETMSLKDIMFYGTSLILMLVTTMNYLLRFIRFRFGVTFAIFLVLNSVFLSWSVYPMNKDVLIWDRQKINNIPLAKSFKPTDRLARVSLPQCDQAIDYVQCVENKFFSKDHGAYRLINGISMSPALRFSRAKNFTQIEVANFIKTFMAKENISTKGVLRAITDGLPITSSRLFDFAAVNYLLSEYPLPLTENLEPVHLAPQFYLYRNSSAWPYYYFADRVETFSSFEDLYFAKKGVAYLQQKDNEKYILDGEELHERNISLVKFEYDEIEFNTVSKEKQFLVLTDSWHPFWHAQVDGKETPVIKTNGILKGISVPSGKHQVLFYFDNSAYKPGILIAIFSWALFIFGWCRYGLNRGHKEINQ
jgi:hypothetical protein